MSQALKVIQDHASAGIFWAVWPFVCLLIIGVAIYFRRPEPPQ